MTDKAYSQMNPGLQFLLYIVVAVVAIFAGYLIGGVIITVLYGASTLLDIAQLNVNTPQAISALWILQLVSTTIPLLLTPVFFAYVVVKEPRTYLKVASPFPLQLLLLVFFIMVVSLPIMEQLININQRLTLPPSLKGVEDWMRSSEQMAEKATNALLKMDTIGDVVKNVLLVGFLTAIAEELVFRGALQTIFMRWTKNPHAAIWITAILFSAFHMEFFGFLPRMVLGIFFGYFVYWSGSIWTSIWAHSLNNGAAVILTYMSQHKTLKVNPDDPHVFNLSVYIFSIIITVLLLFNYRNNAVAAKQQEDI